MESDLLVGQSMVEILNKTKQQFNSLVRTIHTKAIMASGTVLHVIVMLQVTMASHLVSQVHDGSSAKLLSSAAELQIVSSETVSTSRPLTEFYYHLIKVGDALKALSEHKMALDQAEKIEQVCNGK